MLGLLNKGSCDILPFLNPDQMHRMYEERLEEMENPTDKKLEKLIELKGEEYVHKKINDLIEKELKKLKS